MTQSLEQIVYIKAKELLLTDCNDVTINANDFFGYACSDSITISDVDFPWIFPILEEYGREGLYAVLSYIADAKAIKPYRTRTYNRVLAQLQKEQPESWSRKYYNDRT